MEPPTPESPLTETVSDRALAWEHADIASDLDLDWGDESLLQEKWRFIVESFHQAFSPDLKQFDPYFDDMLRRFHHLVPSFTDYCERPEDLAGWEHCDQELRVFGSPRWYHLDGLISVPEPRKQDLSP